MQCHKSANVRQARTLLAWWRMGTTSISCAVTTHREGIPYNSDVALANNLKMTSIERHERRYQRRKQKREERREERLSKIKSVDEIFAFNKMFKYGEQCCRGVMWKHSAQMFKLHLFSRTASNIKRAKNDYKPKPLSKFTISERGKTRQIEAPHIDDRQIQKALVHEVLLPVYLPHMIYNNGASLKGKGLHFSQAQLDKMLHRHINRYGMNGWIITADMKGFFPNADRNVVKENHKMIKNEQVRNILDTITDIGSGDRGLPLGVEPSQVEMIALPSPLDNFMCCQMGLKGFGHYMDDYHIIVPPDRDPKEILEVFIEKAASIGITVSRDKTRIIPFGKPFKFCKMKRIFDKDRIIHRGCRDSVKRLRTKIKKFSKTEMNMEDIATSIGSSLSYFGITDDHYTVLKLKRLFYKEFGFTCEELQRRNKDGVYLPQAV